jgi:predicted AlkP superfamily pyrophosphatase or phosphodiesterase
VSVNKIDILFIMIFCFSFSTISSQNKTTQKPKLILQITVDQLRGDMPLSVYERFGEGGFRYFYEEGIVYQNAHHRHANTETVVGHATLATGADPADHGMIGNVWFDKELGHVVYNIEDPRYPLIGEGGGVDKDMEIDPTQKAATNDGRSPSAMLVSTFSDELNIRYNGKSKIFGVSVKDRGAVTLAGHSGKAFWFSKAKGEFVTSTYYYDDYPKWVSEWNQQKHPSQYYNTAWNLMYDKSTYTYGEDDDKPYETNMPGYGRVFPHNFGDASNKYFTTYLTLSPVGDELTLKFAKELFVQENIGQDDITDFLAVSFSSTDYVGHIFGPNSLESEDNLLRLDKTLANLLSFVDQKVGLENTLVVLSADHGSAAVPGHLNEFGIDAQYFVLDSLKKADAIKNIKDQLGISKEMISGYFHPYIYLNKEVIKENNLKTEEVARAVAKEVRNFAGIAYAVPSIDLIEGNVPDTRLYRQILKNFNSKRSGEIYLVFEPHWFINDFDGLTVASTHGSPWRYDTHVPIIFAGNGIKHQIIYKQVETVDLALTLSKYLNVKAPSGATGNPLIEVLRK